MALIKKRNAQDSTLRNVQAANKRVKALEDRVKALEEKLDAIGRAVDKALERTAPVKELRVIEGPSPQS